MALDVEQIMFLLQRRLNGMQEMKRLTGALLESASRNDQVSIGLLLQMRADEMARLEAAGERIWLMAEQGPEEAGQVRRLMSQEFLKAGRPEGFEEGRIFEIRSKTASLLNQVREADRRLNQSIGGGRSYYASK